MAPAWRMRWWPPDTRCGGRREPAGVAGSGNARHAGRCVPAGGAVPPQAAEGLTAQWITKSGRSAAYQDGRLTIETLEGTHLADPGDFVIQGAAGEFYPCKP